MNPEMLKTGSRSTVIFLAGLVGGWGVSKGWYSQAGLTAFLNSELFGAIVTALVTGGLGVMAKSKFNMLVTAGKLNPEATIIASPAVAAATPDSPNIVAPGTIEAKIAAKVSP